MTRICIILLAVMALATAGAIWTAAHYRNLYTKATAAKPALPNAAGHSAVAVPIIDTYTDAAGSHHAIVSTTLTQLGRKRAEEMFNTSLRPIVDSLTAALSIKTKQVEGYTSITATAKMDEAKFKDRIIDSLKRQTFYYRDKYLNLVFRAGSPTDSLSASSFDFAYDLDLRTVDYMKRKKVLGLAVGRKQYFTDISSSDPRVRIKGAEKFTIPRRMPPFGFRLQALASYNLYTQSYSAGAGIRLDAGDRFNAGANMTYNFGLNTWTPIIYTKYDLVQLGR